MKITQEEKKEIRFKDLPLMTVFEEEDGYISMRTSNDEHYIVLESKNSDNVGIADIAHMKPIKRVLGKITEIIVEEI